MPLVKEPYAFIEGLEPAGRQSNGRLRIAFLTMRDPNNRRSWSGTQFFMAAALEKHCGEVHRLGPLLPFSAKAGKYIEKGVRKLTGRTYLYTHTASLSRKLANMADRKLKQIQCDVIFAPAGSGAIAHLETIVPIVYLSDTTFKLMIDYYPDFTNILKSQIPTAEQLEQLAIRRAAQTVFPSSWAAQSAIDDYHACRDRVNVVPFGANMENPPEREEISGARADQPCRLLFVGVEWQRKGGDIALETVNELQRLGINAELTVVGCRPNQTQNLKYVNFIPFLSKNNARDRERLESLYKSADFFILPTRAECFSIALCEANAYGLPVLSTHTGGLDELVREGINGFLFPLQARGDQYAARIRDVFLDLHAYNNLRRSSRNEFETRLNWDAWGRRMNEILWKAVKNAA